MNDHLYLLNTILEKNVRTAAARDFRLGYGNQLCVLARKGIYEDVGDGDAPHAYRSDEAVLVIGLGGHGVGMRWEPFDASHRSLPGYDTALVIAS